MFIHERNEVVIKLLEDDLMINGIKLPDQIMGRNLHSLVIPTVCNLKNMLHKLQSAGGDYTQLKQWEKRSFKAYNIADIKENILNTDSLEWPTLIRNHILEGEKSLFGASCIDIYLVAYVSNEFSVGKKSFSRYIFEKEITEKEKSVNAIWNVGKGDGVYLGILNNDGSIKDYAFIEMWIKR